MRDEVSRELKSDPEAEKAVRTNGLADLVDQNQFFGNGAGSPFASQAIAQPWTFAEGAAYVPFTLNRIALNYGYMTYGLVQDVIDMVVDDAFRGGLKITSPELDEDDLRELAKAMEENGDIEAIKQTMKWARLFGGAGIIGVTDQDPKTALRTVPKGGNLKFLDANRWELLLTTVSLSGTQVTPGGWAAINEEAPYNYYGVTIHPSRVVRVLGKAAPDMVRARLQGWGMSELERCIREINTYIKFQNLLFELVDEAKVDIYSIEQFTASLASAQGTQAIQLRINMANWLKNYKNALILDKEDTYEQKQIAFGGLADIFEEFRISLCAALKIPYNKLFGQSSTGFSSGEDSMENYNAMVEGEVREKCRAIVREVLKLRIEATFGFEPEFSFEFKPLRVLNTEQEETVNSQRQQRTLDLYDRDLLDGQETMESLHKNGLINVESSVLDGDREPISPLEMQQSGQEQDGALAEKKMKLDAKKTDKANAKANGEERLRMMLRNARIERRAA